MDTYEYPFEKLRVYQEARKLVGEIYRLLRKFPDDEKYVMSAQIRRAVISVTSNIAEGTVRNSLKDKIHFLEMAYGSLMETYSQLQVSMDLGFITEADYQAVKPFIYGVSQPLSGLRNSYLKQLQAK